MRTCSSSFPSASLLVSPLEPPWASLGVVLQVSSCGRGWWQVLNISSQFLDDFLTIVGNSNSCRFSLFTWLSLPELKKLGWEKVRFSFSFFPQPPLLTSLPLISLCVFKHSLKANFGKFGSCVYSRLITISEELELAS